MKESHLTAEVLDRFARGELDDADLSEVVHHLETCPACARAGRQLVANDLAALRAELIPQTVMGRPRVLRWVLAAAAVIAVAILGALLIPKQRPPEPGIVPTTVRRSTPSPVADPRSAPVVVAETYSDPEWQRLVSRADQTGALPFPAGLDELRAPMDAVRGGDGRVERISPTAVVIDEVRPTFTWPPREGGTYAVSVFAGEREVMHSPPLLVPRWTASGDLPRERTLTWQVEVTTPDGAFETIPSPPSPPARFLIASAVHHRDLERARTLHKDDALLMAVLYARSGMRAEAMESLRRAAGEGSAIARKILDHETSNPS